MKKLLFISMFAALLAAGCSKDDGPGGQGPKIPDNEIWYTSVDGNIVEPYSSEEAVEYPFGEGVKILSNTYKNGKGVIKFNASVTKIGDWAFIDCIGLTNVTIPDSVTEIGEYAFCECRNLTSVIIPDSVTEIGEDAFSGCHSLTSVTIPNSVTEIGERVFVNCLGLTSINIPDSVTTIGRQAFCYCRSLTSITIPDSVTTIGDNPFENCYGLTAFYGKFASEDNRCLIVDEELISFAPAGLTEYTIPDGVTEIGRSAFESCSSLTSIDIPDGVTEIGEVAFYSCRSLTSITIPDSVTTIGAAAFEYCHSLTSVYCKAATPPTLRSDVFKYYVNGEHYILENLTAIYVPRASVEAYKAAENWSEYAHLIQPYDF